MTLSTTILSKIHQEIQEEKREILKNTDCILQTDGWKNKSTNTKLLVFGLNNFRTPFVYLSSRDVSMERESGETLSEFLSEAMKYAKDTFQAEVFSTITDNDSKIVCAARLSENANQEPVMTSTCTSHSANRFIHDVADEEFTTILTQVINKFRSPEIEKKILARGGTVLKNFPDTRFCYVINSCESVLKNLQIMRNIINVGNSGIHQQVCDVVSGPDFENDVQQMYDTLTPICILINKCQDPKVNVADAT